MKANLDSSHEMPLLHAVDVGAGDPLVLLHGLGSSHRDWEAQIAAFSGARRVIAFDLRGHGRSPRATRGLTLRDLASDVARSLDARGIESCDLVGWSLGGMIAALVSAERPRLVRSLVIVNSPPTTRPSGPVDRLRWLERKLLTKHLPLHWLGYAIAQRLFKGAHRNELRRTFLERFAENDESSYRAVFEAIAAHDDTGILESIRGPVLVVAGEHDYWPLSQKRAQAARFANGAVSVIARSGHATPVEEPEAFNRVLADFLADPRSAARRSTARRSQLGLGAVALSCLISCSAVDPSAGSDGGVLGGRRSPNPSAGASGFAPDARTVGVGGSGSGGSTGGSGGTGSGGTGSAPGPNQPDAAGGSASVPDAGGTPDSARGADGSRCRVTATTVFCEHNVTPLTAGPTVTRNVYWQTPLSAAPAEGYPLVVVYQGSLFGPALTWVELNDTVPFGGFYQGLLQAKLLDNGFTVVAPEAAGGVAWQTNSGVPYETSTDHAFITALIGAIKAGKFGPADPSRLYATGISSGGYMTSRMAVSYQGVFRALAIQSGSYATCLGPVCTVPATLPADHPPTLFLHGAADTTVPLATMRPYYEKLGAQRVDTELELDAQAGHQWLKSAPERVTDWFRAH